MKTIALATSMEILPPSDIALLNALRDTGRYEVEPTIWSSERDWSEFDGVIVRSCWDYHLRFAEFMRWVDRLERDAVTVCNCPGLIRWNSDKVYLRDLQARGVPIPDTIFVPEGDALDIALVCENKGWEQAVVKPTVSASAYKTHLQRDGVANGAVLVQEFVSAVRDDGEWSLIYFDHEFSHAVRKLPAPHDFRVQKEYGGTVELVTAPTELRDFGDTVLRALSAAPSFARIDVVRNRGALQLMELELIDPELFLNLGEGSAALLAAALTRVFDDEQRSPKPPGIVTSTTMP